MRRAAGFTLKELLIVVGAIGLIDCLLLMAIPRGKPRPSPQIQMARGSMMQLRQAIQVYHQQFGHYPPDTDGAGKLNSAELLYKNLCVPIVNNRVTIGPLFYGGNTSAGNSGALELHSYLGGKYEYRILTAPDGTQTGFLVVDPGADLKMGGTIDPIKGFVKTRISRGPDDVTDDQDNLYSNRDYNYGDE